MRRRVVDRLPDGPLLQFYLYSVTQASAFSVPIYVLFFQSRGLSLPEIGAIEAIYTVVVLVAETPTGYVGDRIGRRNSLLVGTALTAVGIVGFTLAHTFLAFVAVVAVRALAATFRSGTEQAWLYDTLVDSDETDRYARVSGRARGLALAGTAGAALVGAALYSVNPLYPWFAEGVVVALGGAVLLTLPESDAGSGGDSPGLREALVVARETLWRRSLGPVVVASALLAGVLNTMQFYVQPVAVATPWLTAATLGPLYAGFTLVSAVAADRAGWVDERVGLRGWLVVALPALGLLLVAVAAIPALALVAFVVARAVGPVTRPVVSQYVNDRTESRGRATVLSSVSTVRSLFVAPLNVAGGALAGAFALTTALGVLGGVLVVGVAVSMALWQAES
jgi:MFS family permease